VEPRRRPGDTITVGGNVGEGVVGGIHRRYGIQEILTVRFLRWRRECGNKKSIGAYERRGP